MRLIDADRLKAEIMGWCVVTDDLFGMGKYHEREIVLQAIEESPAIDAVPVVRGEWIVTDAYPHRVYCSLCYKTNVPNEEWLYEKNDYPKYCMWCGAKMEVEHETD